MAGKEHKGKSTVFFPNLDALRFFACIVVLNRHSINFILNRHFSFDSRHDIFSYIVRFLNNGGMGVSFFFVLSGFLITYLILDEYRRNGSFNVPAFYVRRALRIWPLYFTVVIIGFLIVPFISKHIGSAIQVIYDPWHYVTFLSNFDYLKHIKLNPADDYSVLDITWSVSIEEQFYIVYALFAFIIPRRALPYYLGLVVLISAAFRYAHSDDPVTNYFHSLAVMSDLAIGGLAAYLSFHWDKFKEGIGHLSQWKIGLIYSLGLCYCIFYSMLSGSYMEVIHRLITGVFFAFVILEQNFAGHSLFKLGNNKYLTRWGKITYGLYLLHPSVFFVTGRMYDWWIHSHNLAIEFIWWLFSYIICFTVCTLSFKYFESYFNKMRHKFAK